MKLLMFNLGVPELIIIFCLPALLVIPKIFYLLTLQKTMESVKFENRKMPSGQVWLEIIPIFGLVWQFFNIINVSDSLKKEFEIRGEKTEEIRPAYSIGIAKCVLSCCSIIPFLGILAGIASIVCWIIFWVKVSKYKNLLK